MSRKASRSIGLANRVIAANCKCERDGLGAYGDATGFTGYTGVYTLFNIELQELIAEFEVSECIAHKNDLLKVGMTLCEF